MEISINLWTDYSVGTVTSQKLNASCDMLVLAFLPIISIGLLLFMCYFVNFMLYVHIVFIVAAKNIH